jgi:VanZ family protein
MAERIQRSRDKAPFGYLVVGLALIPISFTSGGIGWLRITLLVLACVLIAMSSIQLQRNSKRRPGKE